jgi:K(+)-stimulated pyrophosphate-energized sodium pump
MSYPVTPPAAPQGRPVPLASRLVSPSRAALLSLILLLASGAAHAAESNLVLPRLEGANLTLLYFVGLSALVALGYGWWLSASVMRRSPGSAAMQEVQQAIESGAMAYLKKQIGTMKWLVFAIALGLYLLYAPVYNDARLSIGVALAFVMGVVASYVAGYTGMKLAVRANARVAHQALTSFKGALETAFQAGAVAGMVTVGMGLLGATIIFLWFKQDAMKVLVGFGFGGSLAALFMRVGGGIFTKAADVGADLVGKVEEDLPEDDPRNAAVIADNVGDNVGDCAGMAADVFESYEVTLVAAIILGAAAQSIFGVSSPIVMKLIMYALLVRMVGVFASIFGIMLVRGKEDLNMNPMTPISKGFMAAALASVVGFLIICPLYMNDITDLKGHHYEWWRFFGATVMGIILALVIEKLTDHFTGVDNKPVTDIANSARTGPATLILTGFAQGLESSVWSAVAIAATIIGSIVLFPGEPALSMYAIALAGLGLLTTTGFILAEDTYGPISDNANGIFEMSGALKEEEARGNMAPGHIVARLDMVGNTTKALTKGFAIATAVIAAVALFRSFMEDALLTHVGIRIDVPEVFVGALIGAAVPFLFSSFAINAVSRAAQLLIFEVRRQLREMPGIMLGTQKPDYARCVAIVTAAAQKELLAPGILAVATPVLIAFALGYGTRAAVGSTPGSYPGAMALGGYLAGAIITGQLLAVLLSNSGGAWANAKKKIEDGMLGGKGSEAHKAGIIGDTVGDPFKDTAGPALNPLIKVMNLVAILIAPMAIMEITPLVRTVVVVVSAALLLWAIILSKRESEHSISDPEPQTVR